MKDRSEDLSALARRRRLDEAEERRLEALLSSSLEARLLHQAGGEFDVEDSVLPGDDALADKIARNVLREPRRAAVGGRVARAWALAAVFCCVSGVALASSMGVLQLVKPRAPSQAVAVAVSAPAKPHARKHVAKPALPMPVVKAPLPAPEPVVAEPSAPAVAPALHHPRVHARPGLARRQDSALRRAPAVSVQSLFAAANLARREGDSEQALALYAELRRKYAGAPEAHAADMSAGMLELRLGRNHEALAHFSDYLHAGSAGGGPRLLSQSALTSDPLRADALWGKAQALRKLGDLAAAREALGTMLTDYPGSPYAPAARALLSGVLAPP
jgi:tetratricopeptide (TPR) repeat protein